MSEELGCTSLALIKMGCRNKCRIRGIMENGDTGAADTWLKDDQVNTIVGQPSGLFIEVIEVEILRKYPTEEEMMRENYVNR